MPEKIAADLLLGSGFSAEDIEECESALAELGLATAIRVLPPRRAAELTWLVLLTLPLSSFLTAIGSSLAEDAHAALARLSQRLLRRGDPTLPPARTVVLEDRDSGVRVILDDELPEQAFRALLRTDLAAEPGETLRYDGATRRWTAG
jgi:hypothetical protein